MVLEQPKYYSYSPTIRTMSQPLNWNRESRDELSHLHREMNERLATRFERNWTYPQVKVSVLVEHVDEPLVDPVFKVEPIEDPIVNPSTYTDTLPETKDEAKIEVSEVLLVALINEP